MDVLSTALAAWDVREESIQSWPDEGVLRVCDVQMASQQSQRLSGLLDRQQAGKLTLDERPELWVLARWRLTI